MKSYTLKKISGAPDWSTIPVLYMDTQLWSDPVDIQAQAQLCWDQEAIYVRLKAVEKDIRAEYTGQLDMVCEDSCLEFFLRPTESLRYINIEFNPNCALYLGYGSSIYDSVRLIQSPENNFSPKAQRNEDGWEISYRVPFQFIQLFFPDFVPAENTQFYGNFYKCGDETPHPHYFLWQPVTEKPASSFHSPAEFGRLILGGSNI